MTHPIDSSSSPLQRNKEFAGCERVMTTRAEFHFSWVYTFSATLRSLRILSTWSTERDRLRPSTPCATVLIVRQTSIKLAFVANSSQLLFNHELVLLERRDYLVHKSFVSRCFEFKLNYCEILCVCFNKLNSMRDKNFVSKHSEHIFCFIKHAFVVHCILDSNGIVQMSIK